MEVARMKAERRSALGRNQIKKLRTEGWMPAVVYGGEGKEPVSIQISEWELDCLLYTSPSPRDRG